jgi:hypothetical protein
MNQVADKQITDKLEKLIAQFQEVLYEDIGSII